MIQLTCSKCKVVLTMDDAFAGGVCRCQHCGTIQTVPRELKHPAKNGGPAAAGKALVSKPLKRPPDGAPSLEDLEQVVVSSGLAATDFANPIAPPPPPHEPFFGLLHAVLFGAWGLGMFLLGVLITWLLMRTPGG